MITDAILDVLASMVNWFLQTLPTYVLPTWYDDAIEGWGAVVSGIAALAHWVPLDAVTQVAIAVFLVSAFSFGVRVLRIVLSFASGGGGGAA